MNDQVYSIQDAAARLGCSRTHVYALIAAGELRAVNIALTGRSKTRVRSDDLAAYIARQTVEAVRAS